MAYNLYQSQMAAGWKEVTINSISLLEFFTSFFFLSISRGYKRRRHSIFKAHSPAKEAFQPTDERTQIWSPGPLLTIG
jgi:hypothetical protein